VGAQFTLGVAGTFPPRQDGIATFTRDLLAAVATAASTAPAGLERGHGSAEEGLRTLLDEAERIRLELLTLADARGLLRTQANDEAAVRKQAALRYLPFTLSSPSLTL